MKYRFIEENKQTNTIAFMCDTLNIAAIPKAISHQFLPFTNFVFFTFSTGKSGAFAPKTQNYKSNKIDDLLCALYKLNECDFGFKIIKVFWEKALH